MSIIGLILIIIVLIIIVSVIAFAIRIVPQSKAYVVERIVHVVLVFIFSFHF